MFNNMLVTSLTPLRNIDEIAHWQNRPFISKWPQNQPQETFQIQQNSIIKPLKRHRTCFTPEQLLGLEKAFKETEYVNPIIRKTIANELKLKDKCVKVWFQNRRMRKKKEILESPADTSSQISNITSPTKEPYDLSQVSTTKTFPSNFFMPSITPHPVTDFTAVSNSLSYNESISSLPTSTTEPVICQPFFPYPHYYPPTVQNQNVSPPIRYYNKLQSEVASHLQFNSASSPETNNDAESYTEAKKEDDLKTAETNWSSLLKCISE